MRTKLHGKANKAKRHLREQVKTLYSTRIDAIHGWQCEREEKSIFPPFSPCCDMVCLFHQYATRTASSDLVTEHKTIFMLSLLSYENSIYFVQFFFRVCLFWLSNMCGIISNTLICLSYGSIEAFNYFFGLYGCCLSRNVFSSCFSKSCG